MNEDALETPATDSVYQSPELVDYGTVADTTLQINFSGISTD